MGSGASTVKCDAEYARDLAGTLWDGDKFEATADDEGCCTLGELEEAAGVVALQFPRDGLILDLSAHAARRAEEDGVRRSPGTRPGLLVACQAEQHAALAAAPAAGRESGATESS